MTHKLVSFQNLPQGVRPVSSGLPLAAVSNVAKQHGRDAVIVRVGQRYSVYAPVVK